MTHIRKLSVRLPIATIGLAFLSATVMGGFIWSLAKSGLISAANESESINSVTTGLIAAIEEQGVTTQDIVRSMASDSTGTSDVTNGIAVVSTVADEAGADAVSDDLASNQILI